MGTISALSPCPLIPSALEMTGLPWAPICSQLLCGILLRMLEAGNLEPRTALVHHSQSKVSGFTQPDTHLTSGCMESLRQSFHICQPRALELWQDAGFLTLPLSHGPTIPTFLSFSI